MRFLAEYSSQYLVVNGKNGQGIGSNTSHPIERVFNKSFAGVRKLPQQMIQLVQINRSEQSMFNYLKMHNLWVGIPVKQFGLVGLHQEMSALEFLASH